MTPIPRAMTPLDGQHQALDPEMWWTPAMQAAARVYGQTLWRSDGYGYRVREIIAAYEAAREEPRWTPDLLDDWNEYTRCRDRGTHQRDRQERCVECGFDRDDFPEDEPPAREDTERPDAMRLAMKLAGDALWRAYKELEAVESPAATDIAHAARAAHAQAYAHIEAGYRAALNEQAKRASSSGTVREAELARYRIALVQIQHGLTKHTPEQIATAALRRVAAREAKEPSVDIVRPECEECGGNGYVRIDQPGLEDYGVEPEREDCEACHGSGVAREDTETLCPTCGGPLEGAEGSRCSRSACPTNLMMPVAREDTERPDDEEGLRPVMLCKLCRAGAGGECHMPGCGLYGNRAPDIPVRDTERPDERLRELLRNPPAEVIHTMWRAGHDLRNAEGRLPLTWGDKAREVLRRFESAVRDTEQEPEL